MEKLTNVPGEERNDHDNKLNIHVFRHGDTEYTQPFDVSIEDANDLTNEAIEKMKKSAEELARQISSDEEAVIWSSPLGRTLHSARIIAEMLSKEGVNLRRRGNEEEREHGIRIMPQLTEYDRPDWSVIMPIIEGGEVSYKGKKFYVDKQYTNPSELDWKTYWVRGGLDAIPEDVKNKWPQDYRDAIDSIETFTDLKERTLKPLNRLKNLSDKNYRIIIVTHDGLTAIAADPETQKSSFRGIKKGESISMRRDDKGNLQQI